jgi:hypothetical protein
MFGSCFGSFQEVLRAPKRLETQGNRAEEDRDREIFFLSGVRVIGTPRRKPALEQVFGFAEVRRVGPEVLREPETIDPILGRISVQNVMGDQ